jgi:hypothetical protein
MTLVVKSEILFGEILIGFPLFPELASCFPNISLEQRGGVTHEI